MVASSSFKFEVGEQVKVVLSGDHFGRVGRVRRQARIAKTKMPRPVPDNIYWIVFEEGGKECGFAEENLEPTLVR